MTDLSFMNEEKALPGLYVAAFFSEETNEKLGAWMRENNIQDPVAEASLHTTIVHSRVPVVFEPNHTLDIKVDTRTAQLEIWDTPSGRTLVLHYFSPYLHIRFFEAMAAGATYDYDEYKPHVSLSYDVGPDFTIDMVSPIDFSLVIAGEYSEELDPE